MPPSLGVELPTSVANPPRRSPPDEVDRTSYLLWLLCLIGFCGIHRFYNGRIVTASSAADRGLFLIGQIIDLFPIPGMNATGDSPTTSAGSRNGPDAGPMGDQPLQAASRDRGPHRPPNRSRNAGARLSPRRKQETEIAAVHGPVVVQVGIRAARTLVAKSITPLAHVAAIFGANAVLTATHDGSGTTPSQIELPTHRIGTVFGRPPSTATTRSMRGA